jgi:hypothetical protein
VIINNSQPTLLGAWLECVLDSFPPDFGEVRKADGGVLDHPEVLAARDIAENAFQNLPAILLCGPIFLR